MLIKAGLRGVDHKQLEAALQAEELGLSLDSLTALLVCVRKHCTTIQPPRKGLAKAKAQGRLVSALGGGGREDARVAGLRGRKGVLTVREKARTTNLAEGASEWRACARLYLRRHHVLPHLKCLETMWEMASRRFAPPADGPVGCRRSTAPGVHGDVGLGPVEFTLSTWTEVWSGAPSWLAGAFGARGLHPTRWIATW